MKFIPIAIILSIIVCSLATTDSVLDESGMSQEEKNYIVKAFNEMRQNLSDSTGIEMVHLNWNSQLEIPEMDCSNTTLDELNAKFEKEIMKTVLSSSLDDFNDVNTISKCYNLRITNLNCVKRTCSDTKSDFNYNNCVCGVWPRITTLAPTTVATTTTITTTTFKPTTTTDNECGDDDELCEDGSSNLSIIAPVFFTVIFYLLA